MERLFAPWRSVYIKGFKGDAEEKKCIFCSALESRETDRERMVVYRGREVFVIMNLYPYNSGHMMIVPNRHTADLQSLTESELRECMQLLQAAQQALRELASPHGYNIGMNLGRAAGAGVEDHLHWHIVPRWNGDTNFMPVLADIKLVSEDMREQWVRLHQLFEEIVGNP